MSKKSLILSSILPSLSIILSIVLIIMLNMYGEWDMTFTIALGIVCGGAAPLFLILAKKTDISAFWIGKIILLGLFWLGFWFSWFVIPDWTGQYLGRPLFLPILILIAEILFAATRKTNLKTGLCLVFASPIWLYTGFTIDFARAVWAGV